MVWVRTSFISEVSAGPNVDQNQRNVFRELKLNRKRFEQSVMLAKDGTEIIHAPLNVSLVVSLQPFAKIKKKK